MIEQRYTLLVCILEVLDSNRVRDICYQGYIGQYGVTYQMIVLFTVNATSLISNIWITVNANIFLMINNLSNTP
jgi:hypothetical protein